MSDNSNKDEQAPMIDFDKLKSVDEPQSSYDSEGLDMSEQAMHGQPVSEISQWPLKLTGVLVFILALVVIYLWQQLGTMQTQIEQNVSVALEKELQALQQQNAQQLADTQVSLNQYQKQQQLLQGTLEATQGQLQKQSDKNIDLLKAESLLSLANDRYVLMRDVGTSILAMRQALKQLEHLELPAINTIKEQIHKELLVLQNIERVDVSAYLHTLNQMIALVDDLSLIAPTQRTTASPAETKHEPTSSTWEVKWQQLLQALKPMLLIRRSAEAPQVVLSQEEDRLVRLVLKSRYEYVRQALLREDDDMLGVAVSTAREWLERYFNSQQASLQSSLKTLSALSSSSFDVDYPPIGAALEQLSQHIAQSIPGAPAGEEGGETP